MEGKERLDKKQLCDIIMGVIIQIYCFFPWISSENGKINIWLYLIRDMKAEDSKEWYRSVFLPNVETLSEDVMSVPAYFRFILFIVAAIQILCLLYMIASVTRNPIVDLLGRIRVVILSLFIIAGGLFADMGFSGGMVTIEGERATAVTASIMLYLLAFILLVAAWMLMGQMIESWDEEADRVKMERERKRLYRQERKRRLYFAGRYSRLYYKILFKDFKCRSKSYLFLVLSVFLSAFFLFAGIGMRGIFSADYEEAGSGALGLGLLEIMQDFLLAITVVAIFLITMVLSAYWKKRLGSIGVFRILGIRRDALFKEWMGELVICFLTAVSVGMLVGSIFLHFLKRFLKSAFPEIGKLGSAGWGAYVGTFLGMLVIFLFALGFAHDMQTAKNSQDIRGALVQSERMPGKRKFLWTGGALVIAAYCLLRFAQRRTAESIVVFSIFLLAMFIVFYNLWSGQFQDMKKNRALYLRRLPKVHMVRYRYQTTVRYICLLTMLHVYFLFFFLMKAASSMIAAEPQELFPYDYVFLANSSDEGLSEELQRTCEGEVFTFPMVRATTIDNTEAIDRPDTIILQQGQNIGVSETTYRELKALVGEEVKEDLPLDDKGNRIYIVYQQDQAGKAKPLDWYMMTKQPYLHIGQPLFAYNVHEYEKYYPLREIAGEERESLTGCFKQGKYENLVVFSDAYFEKVKDYWKETDMYTGEPVSADGKGPEESGGEIYEGPTRLILARVPEEYRKKADEIVSCFRKIHEYDESLDPLVDSAYVKDEAVRRRQMEHVLEIMVNGFICAMLLIVSILLLYIRTETELPEMKERYQLMKRLGMRQKERIQIEKKEIARFVIIPLGMAVPVVLVFTGIVFWLRDFSWDDVIAYGIWGGGICLLYILFQLAVMKCLQYRVVRQVEKRV